MSKNEQKCCGTGKKGWEIKWKIRMIATENQIKYKCELWKRLKNQHGFQETKYSDINANFKEATDLYASSAFATSELI